MAAELTSRLCLLFTPELCKRDPWDTLRVALEGGVDLVQWRSKRPARADELEHTRAICRAAGVPWIVNDDVDLAVAMDADGAHVGQDDLPAAVARARLGPDRWLGVSTHDLDQIRAAERDGADYVGFGPCFPTATKGYSEGLPAAAIEAACATATVPLFAIGGIDAGNVGDLFARGVRRVAVCSALLHGGAPQDFLR